MASTDRCEKPRTHDAHLCQLLHQGRMEEFDQRRTQPSVICGRCGFTANEARDVCQPRPL